MSAREFRMKLSCTYTEDNNTVDQLSVQHLVEQDWVDFELGLRTAGFDIFMYAVLTCQHTYMRLNAAEQGVQLQLCEGSLHIAAGEDWNIERLDVKFTVQAAAAPAADTVDYIIERMQRCPVSVNLQHSINCDTRLEFR